MEKLYGDTAQQVAKEAHQAVKEVHQIKEQVVRYGKAQLEKKTNPKSDMSTALYVAAGVAAVSAVVCGYFYWKKKEAEVARKKNNVYETQQMVNEYLLMHFGLREHMMSHR